MRWVRLLVAGFAVSAMSCLAPTEIILVLSTDVACAVVAQNGVAIALGEPGDEDSGIATTTKLCSDDGGIGTAVLLPHTSIDQPVGIRVTLGVDAAADNCGPNFAGCIVARRSLRFDPHTPLTLPIALDQSCIGVPCTPNSTCVSGACVDAGVACDGSSCGIEDAGVADAGAACEPVSDILVASATGQGNARVALSADGWGVAYQTPQLGVELRHVHVSGGTPNISVPVTLVPPNQANLIGPLAGDTTANSYAISYSLGTTAYATIVASDGTPKLTGPFDFVTASPAHYGMFPLGQDTYATAFISGSNADGFAVPFSPQNGAQGVGLGTTSVKDIAFARGASAFFATTADQAGVCHIFTCSYGGSFSCSPSGNFPSCAALRVAERAGILSHVLQSAKILTVDDLYPLGANVQGSNFVVIATRDVFHVVYVTTASSVAIATYDGSGKSAPMTMQLLPQGGGSVFAVDAVADGPNQTGYAIVYTAIDAQAVTNVRFMHLCL